MKINNVEIKEYNNYFDPTGIIIPEGITDIYAIMFKECCEKIRYVKFPKSLIEIHDYSFLDKYNLKHILFDSDCELKHIGRGAFAYTGLKYVYLPSKLETIDHYAFKNKSLEILDLSNTSIKEFQISNILETNIKTLLVPLNVKIFNSTYPFDDDLDLYNRHEYSNTNEFKIIRKGFDYGKYNYVDIVSNSKKLKFRLFNDQYSFKRKIIKFFKIICMFTERRNNDKHRNIKSTSRK